MTNPLEFIPIIMRVEYPSKTWSVVMAPPRVQTVLDANPTWTMEEGCAALFSGDNPWSIVGECALHDGTNEVLFFTLKPKRVLV